MQENPSPASGDLNPMQVNAHQGYAMGATHKLGSGISSAFSQKNISDFSWLAPTWIIQMSQLVCKSWLLIRHYKLPKGGAYLKQILSSTLKKRSGGKTCWVYYVLYQEQIQISITCSCYQVWLPRYQKDILIFESFENMLPIAYAVVDLTPCVIHGARHLIFTFLNLVGHLS